MLGSILVPGPPKACTYFHFYIFIIEIVLNGLKSLHCGPKITPSDIKNPHSGPYDDFSGFESAYSGLESI